jgi:hypothetical protein
MSRRAAISIAVVVAVAWVSTLAASSFPRAHLPAAPITTPAFAKTPRARGTRTCASGPGTAVTALARDGAPDLAALARRAFAFDRLAERSGAGPALPQRMGADLGAAPPATCVDLP